MRITRLRTIDPETIQGTDVEEPFERIYARMLPNLKKMSYTQSVIGYTAEDIFAEMAEILWKAWETYDPSRGDENLTFEKYWWACWHNHKWKLVRSVTTHKAKMEQSKVYDTVGVDDDGLSLFNMMADEGVAPIPPCPLPDDAEACLLWRMTALGYTSAEVKIVLGVDRRGYDTILARLRSASEAVAA